MKEENVFWVGTQPLLGKKAKGLADDESFVAAIRATCEAAGCQVHRFVSALGPYGTWVVEIERDGRQQRIVWNGKDERLVLQLQLSQGGWEDPFAIEVTKQEAGGFVDGVKEILAWNEGN